MNNTNDTSNNSPYVPTTQAKEAKTNPVGALFKMFYEPTAAFQQLEPKKHAWLPLILVILTMMGMTLWYFTVVDGAWFVEQLLAPMKPAEREMAAKVMSPGMVQTSMLGGNLVGIPLVAALTALYLMLAGKITKSDIGFGTGFALTAWSYIPMVLLLPLAGIQLMMASNGQLEFSQLNPLSINQLFFQYPMGDPRAGALDALSVTSIWSSVLMVFGYKTWGKTSTATAIKVVAIPSVVIYGAWIAYAMSTTPA